MDEEGAPVKAKIFQLKAETKAEKKEKEIVEKNMLVRGLKRTDAKDQPLWSLRCKNRLTHVAVKISRVLEEIYQYSGNIFITMIIIN